MVVGCQDAAAANGGWRRSTAVRARGTRSIGIGCLRASDTVSDARTSIGSPAISVRPTAHIPHQNC